MKPGNVWLTGDGIAKIGDFGLAVARDRSRLTTEAMMVGTLGLTTNPNVDWREYVLKLLAGYKVY